MTVKSIKASANGFNVIGTFEGEALDTNITNKNGLDIPRDVIEVLLESDEYNEGLKNGWFIGYLGHPEDIDCQEFQDACIVMTDMRLEDNGKVYATFNLIDTPVGQIVKKFQESGVNFGISIRGAGDIYNNTVAADTFVFRGFDLVAFPAYPESIPEFKAISASTKAKLQKNYSVLCNTIKASCNKIENYTTVDAIQKVFAKQSDEYRLLENRKTQITSSASISHAVSKQKIKAMTDLYADIKSENRQLQNRINKHTAASKKVIAKANIKADKATHKAETTSRMLVVANRKLRATEEKLEIANKKIEQLRTTNTKLKEVNSATRNDYNRKVTAMKRISADQLNVSQRELERVTASYNRLNSKVKDLKNNNLIYKSKIEKAQTSLDNKESVIAGLKTELHETVTANKKIENSTSNLDTTNKKLNSEIKSCKNKLKAFQEAFASIYASAIGVNLDELNITENTSIDEIKQMVNSATNTSNIAVAPAYGANEEYYDYPSEYNNYSYEDFYNDDDVAGYSADLVTM